jgi:toxin ParE2
VTFRFLSPALVEATEAAEFYDARLPGLGADFLSEVDSTIARIVMFPEGWPRISGPFRQCPLRRFPYRVIYLIASDEEVLIFSVFHQSRAPLSWKPED